MVAKSGTRGSYIRFGNRVVLLCCCELSSWWATDILATFWDHLDSSSGSPAMMSPGAAFTRRAKFLEGCFIMNFKPGIACICLKFWKHTEKWISVDMNEKKCNGFNNCIWMHHFNTSCKKTYQSQFCTTHTNLELFLDSALTCIYPSSFSLIFFLSLGSYVEHSSELQVALLCSAS